MSPCVHPSRRLTLARAPWWTLALLILIVLVSAAMRVSIDLPNVAAGEVPDEGEFDRRYALHPVLAYAHILPGVVYLVGAPLQLSRRFRERHLAVHRRLGRVLLPAGIAAGILGVAFGTLFPFGGPLEASATVVFGAYFVVALVTALAAIRAGDVARHRRWMIRAFAIGLAVGTIRVWVGLLAGLGFLTLEDSFGVAFWLAFAMHGLAAEAYLSRRPAPRATRS